MQIKFNFGVGSVMQLAILFKFAVDHVWSVKYPVGFEYLREDDGVYEFVSFEHGAPNYKQVRTIIPVGVARLAVRTYLEKNENNESTVEDIADEIIVSDLVKHAREITESVDFGLPTEIVVMAPVVGYWKKSKFEWFNHKDSKVDHFWIHPSVAGVPKTNLLQEFSRKLFFTNLTPKRLMLSKFGYEDKTSWKPQPEIMYPEWNQKFFEVPISVKKKV